MRSSLSSFRRRASLLPKPDRRDAARCRGSRSDTTILLTSGKLCSHVGSWITIGTTSQRCSAAISQVSLDGAGRKSESRKTNVPGVTARGYDASWSIERSSQSAGPVELRRPELWIAHLDHLPIALRRPPVRVTVGVVEIADVAAGGTGAREDQLDDGPHRAAACPATETVRRTATSADDGRRGSSPSAPPRRSSRGRRTRRSPARSRDVPTPPSRSRPCRRRAGTVAIRRRPSRTLCADFASSRTRDR